MRLTGVLLNCIFRPIKVGGKHTAQADIVVVVQLVNSLDLATNVQLLNGLVQVNDSRVLGVTTEDEVTLLLPRIRGKRIRQQPDPLRSTSRPWTPSLRKEIETCDCRRRSMSMPIPMPVGRRSPMLKRRKSGDHLAPCLTQNQSPSSRHGGRCKACQDVAEIGSMRADLRPREKKKQPQDPQAETRHWQDIGEKD